MIVLAGLGVAALAVALVARVLRLARNDPTAWGGHSSNGEQS